MKSEQDFRLQLSKIKNLPPLPEVSVRIMNTVNDPEVSVNELVDVLSLSPSLVARLLGLANSAYFGCPGKIDDLRKAIIQVLGLNLVKSLSLSIALNVQLDSRKCKAFDPDYYWLHALTTAVLAQKLSAKSNMNVLQPAAVYTSGLLLNIGILVAVFLFPEQMHEVFSRCQKSGLSVHEGIKSIVGLSHYKLGYLLLNRWHLPLIYQSVLKEFDSSQIKGDEMPLVVLQQVSQSISGLIVKGKPVTIQQFAIQLETLSLSVDESTIAIDQIIASKNDIQELATIIRG